MADSDSAVERADQHRHADGALEVVFHVEGGRVLTVKEYPSLEMDRAAVADATPLGKHDGVLDLPDAAAFQEMDF